jgi:uncharacterized membrane protein
VERVVKRQGMSRETVPSMARVPRRGAARLGPRARAWIVYVAAVGVAFALLWTTVAAPWLATHGFPVAGASLYLGFAKACHQMPDRSFWVFGAPMAVCSRCAALYAGGLLGLLLVPLLRGIGRPAPHRLWLAAAACPVALDFGLGWLGILENTFWSRGVTGLVLGTASAFYILPGLIDAAMAHWGPGASHGDAHGLD